MLACRLKSNIVILQTGLWSAPKTAFKYPEYSELSVHLGQSYGFLSDLSGTAQVTGSFLQWPGGHTPLTRLSYGNALILKSHDHVVAGSKIWDSASSARIKNTGAGFLPAVLPPASWGQEGSREIHSKLCFFLGEYVKPDDLDFVDGCMSSYYQSVSSLLESSGRFEAWSHGPGTSSLANSVSCNHDVCDVLITSLVRGVSEHAGKDQSCSAKMFVK